MISLILVASDDARAMSRLLTALTPGAAERVIREVAVLGAAGASYEVADDAGADLYPADAFAEAFERAKGPWVAGLPLEVELAPHWIEALAAHLAREPAAPARLVARGFAQWLTGGKEGWLVPKRLATSAAAVREQDLQRLARRSGRRLRILTRG
jgi:hypothetical protein